MVRPRLKGFHLSQRARDPEVARVESVAAAAIAIGRRARGVSPGSVTGCAALTANQPAGGDIRCTDVIEKRTGDSEAPSALRQEADEIGGEGKRDPQNLIAKTTESSPTAVVKNRDEDENANGNTSVVSVSISSKDTLGPLGAEEEKNTPPVEKAIASTTMHKAEKTPETATVAARCESVCDTTTPAQVLDRCSKSSDTVLSHRSRVRSVVFSRPHTHQARKASRRRGEISVSPGPGQYEVVGLGSFGHKNMSGRSSMFASER